MHHTKRTECRLEARMPYIRLYSRDVPLHEKRWIAQRLISITQHSFHLPPEDVDNITIQFLPLYKSPAMTEVSDNATGQLPEITLEVSSEELSQEVVSSFV